jgi:cytidine deaminase
MTESSDWPADDPRWEPLIAAARDAADHAWAPYSNYHVGAALLDTDGGLHSGCNVENATYGATVCAERNAVAAAVRAGATRYAALVVHVEADDPAVPCGLCRQVLCEFATRLPILSVTRAGQRRRTDLATLLPDPFGRASLEQAQAQIRARGDGPPDSGSATPRSTE